jgi:molybdopterin converting factor small subunit
MVRRLRFVSWTFGKRASMNITVELFGIPRQRAGVSRTDAVGTRLDEVVADLARRFPRLAEECFREDRGGLKPGTLANLNGKRFVTDPATALTPGDALLILSADAGG